MANLQERAVLFSDYAGTALTEKDYDIYLKRKGSACLMYEGKTYDQDAKVLIDRDDPLFCVADCQDREYISFRRMEG